jgi:hypothetical protein
MFFLEVQEKVPVEFTQVYSRAMKVAEIRITEAILFKLGLLSLVNFSAREYNKTGLQNCTFENLTWGIYAQDISTYDVNIANSFFKNVAQAFATGTASGKVNITNGKGEKLSYWIFLHKTGGIEVTIDQASINNVPNASFAHRYLDKQEYERRAEKPEVSSYTGDYDERKNSLRHDPFIDNTYIQSIKKQNDYDSTLIYLKRELQNELREIDFSDSDVSNVKLHIRRSITLCYLLADSLMTDFDWEFGVKSFISDEALRKKIVNQCLWNPDQLAILELSTPNIFWGNSGNMRAVFTKLKISLADRIFRENLHIFRDWLEALAETEKSMQELSKP